MSTRKMLTAFVTVLLLAAIFAGIDAWKTYAQGPGGNNSPCGGYGSGWNTQGGMMGHHTSGWNNQQGMMGGMMGHHTSGWNNQQGMMGGWGYSDDCFYEDWMGPMMGGQQGQGGYSYMGGYGMMDNWLPPQELVPAGDTLTQTEATKIADAYLATLGDDTLSVGDVVEFNRYFHVTVVQKDSGDFAFGFMIDAATGQVWAHHWQNNAAGTFTQ